MLTINISHLRPGIHEYELGPAASELELDPNLFEDIRVGARLDYSGDRILLTLETWATATLECDRTLVEFEQPVHGNYLVLYGPQEILAENVEAYGDVQVLRPSDQEIDITEAVRDTLLLSLPTRRIAPGAEDIEIQTSFGSPEDDDYVDPRWEALRKLRSDDKP